MTRYAHWLEPLKEDNWPQRILCVDCQSTPIIEDGKTARHAHGLVAWNAIGLHLNGDDYHSVYSDRGDSAASFWTALGKASRREGSLLIVSFRCQRVWALLELWDAIETGEVTFGANDKGSAGKSRAGMRDVRRGKSDPLAPVSSAALLAMSARDCGLLVVEDPPSIASFRVQSFPTKATWIDCRNHGVEPRQTVAPGGDTAAWLSDWIVSGCAMLRRLGMGGLATTVGAQAMRGFRRTYYKGGIYCGTDERAVSVESASYCGGRCECRKIGSVASTVFHVDRRSAYGYHQCNDALPIRHDGIRHGGAGGVASATVDATRSIATVDLETQEPDYPMRRNGLVVFPVGRFTTTLCGPELADALASDRVRKVHCVSTYAMERALKGYADAVYGERCAADNRHDATLSRWCKSLLVCLPGKFGQRDRKWVIDHDASTDIQWGEWTGSDEYGEPVRYRAIAGIVHRSCDDGLTSNAVPAMAAWVNSLARMELLRAIRCAGRAEVHYYDTDSIICTATGYQRLQDGGFIADKVLGAWSLRERGDCCAIYGVKYYTIDGATVHAGKAKGRAVSSQDGLHYWYDTPLAEALKQRRQPQAETLMLSIAQATKYQHGNVAEDGTVSPFRLEDW